MSICFGVRRIGDDGWAYFRRRSMVTVFVLRERGGAWEASALFAFALEVEGWHLCVSGAYI